MPYRKYLATVGLNMLHRPTVVSPTVNMSIDTKPLISDAMKTSSPTVQTVLFATMAFGYRQYPIVKPVVSHAKSIHMHCKHNNAVSMVNRCVVRMMHGQAQRRMSIVRIVTRPANHHCKQSHAMIMAFGHRIPNRALRYVAKRHPRALHLLLVAMKRTFEKHHGTRSSTKRWTIVWI